MRRAAVISIACVLAIVGLALAQSTPQVYMPLVVNPPTLTPIPPTPTTQPTATTQPTPTTQPTATAQPTATQQPSGVVILGGTSSYVDSIDYLHVIGEVQNNTSSNLQFVKITANFFNGTGQLVDTDFTYTYLDHLPPNTRTCFHLLLQQPAGWASYQFEAPTYSTTTQGLPNLVVLGDSGSYQPSLKSYKIIGQVQNNEAVQVRFVQPIGTLYNSVGIPIGCGFTFVSSTDLNPGQTSSFDMQVFGRDYNDVVSYRLQVDGQKQ